MPNTDNPAGFQSSSHGGGGTPGRLGSYNLPSGHPEDIFTGDPVVMTGTGREIQLAVAGNDNNVVGIFRGVKYVDANGDQQFLPYWRSGTVVGGTPEEAPEALVQDDYGMLFVVQVNGTGLTAADVGNQANLIAGAGSFATGQSAYQLDQTSIAAAGRQFRIEGLAPVPENEYGEFAKALVSVRTHQRLAAAGF